MLRSKPTPDPPQQGTAGPQQHKQANRPRIHPNRELLDHDNTSKQTDPGSTPTGNCWTTTTQASKPTQDPPQQGTAGPRQHKQANRPRIHPNRTCRTTTTQASKPTPDPPQEQVEGVQLAVRRQKGIAARRPCPSGARYHPSPRRPFGGALRAARPERAAHSKKASSSDCELHLRNAYSETKHLRDETPPRRNASETKRLLRDETPPRRNVYSETKRLLRDETPTPRRNVYSETKRLLPEETPTPRRNVYSETKRLLRDETPTPRRNAYSETKRLLRDETPTPRRNAYSKKKRLLQEETPTPRRNTSEKKRNAYSKTKREKTLKRF